MYDNKIITIGRKEDEIEILNEENNILAEEVAELQVKLTTARIACIILGIAFIASWVIVVLA